MFFKLGLNNENSIHILPLQSPSTIYLHLESLHLRLALLVSLIINTYRISQCTICGQFNLAGTYVK
jgi:hypothetical protein